MNDPGAHAPPADVDYELIRMIGRGGYGEVWLVRDKAGKYFACKAVYRESFQHERPYEREYDGICKFEPVSRASESQLKILHLGRRDAEGYFYYIMELADDANSRAVDPENYVPKTLFSELKSKNKLPAKECIQIGISLSAALENLHRHGLIHRDIKPGNIVFVNGVPKLADIGLVTDLDVTISYVGTEGYIPPEGPTSSRADIYSLGKVLYEISTGKDRLQYPELPADFVEIPDWEQLLELNAVIAKACEANPGRRYASAEELLGDLALLAAGKSVRKRRAAQRKRRLMGQIVLAVAVMGIIAGGLAYLLKHQFFRAQSPQIKIVSDKIPVPDAGLVAQSESKLKQDYRDQLNGTVAGKQKVAAELFDQSSSESDPTMQLASLQLAAELSVEAGDFSRAMEICDAMASRFQMNITPVKASLLSQAATHVSTPRDKMDLGEICVAAGFQAITANDYASASKLAALAESLGQQSSNAHLAWQSKFLADETARCAAEFERVKQFATTLQDRPEDPAANLAMGKFICFFKNNWSVGLPMLARGDDAQLKPVVNQEINGAFTDAQQQIALGKLWQELSATAPDDEKNFYRERARYWFLKGIANSGEAERKILRQELAEFLKGIPTQPAEVRIISRVSGTEFIDIYSDEIQWRSSHRGTIGNMVNQVNVGDFTSADLQIIKNGGATRLMPHMVDFSTARLDNDTRARRRDSAKLAIFEDHVRLTLSHQRAGAAGMDVTVIFGSP